MTSGRSPGATGPAFTPEAVVRHYFHAKDKNRPRLLDRVFAPGAELEVRNRSDAISFPARTTGRDAIADVLVRSFGRTHENVYSFALERPDCVAASFSCGWLVAMSEKSTGRVRVGCGRCDWQFDPLPPGLAQSLVIRIDVMLDLAAGTAADVFEAVARLDYPWTSRTEAVAAIGGVAALAPIVRALAPDADDVADSG